MIEMNTLLDMIATEAADGSVDGCLDHGRQEQNYEPRKPYNPNEPSFRYNLELIRKPDGTLEWIE